MSNIISYSFDRIQGNTLPKDTWKEDIVRIALKKRRSIFWIRFDDTKEEKMYKLVPEEV